MANAFVAKVARLLGKDSISAARGWGVQVGDRCRFLGTTEETFGSEPYLIKIGDHVTVTEGVQFITHDGGVWVLRDEDPTIDVFAPIVVGNNAFLGFGAIIMPGVTIGDNSIVAAGSVVTKDVAANTIVAGVPARPVRTLDESRETAMARSLGTKGMPAAEKRAFLLKHFADQLGETNN